MNERRRSPRSSCRLHCRVQRGRDQFLARIVDISDGGLCLYSPVRIEANSEVDITIDVPGLPQSVIRAEVWHVRQLQLRSSPRKVWVVGMMLSRSDDAFAKLLATAGVIAKAEESDRSDASETHPEQRIFRIRVQERAGARTRLLTLAAVTQFDARRLATKDLDPKWKILEVLDA